MDINEEPKKIDIGPGDDVRVTHREHKRDGSGLSRATTVPPYAEHGALIDRSQTAEEKTSRGMNRALMWPRIRYHLRDAFSEFMGTFILIMFGDGGVAQVVLSRGEKGDYQSISWAWVSLHPFFGSVLRWLTCVSGHRCDARCLRLRY